MKLLLAVLAMSVGISIAIPAPEVTKRANLDVTDWEWLDGIRLDLTAKFFRKAPLLWADAISRPLELRAEVQLLLLLGVPDLQGDWDNNQRQILVFQAKIQLRGPIVGFRPLKHIVKSLAPLS
ncbi:hypothetical protein FQN49_004898 [Arthroderma sp. PD_2]|nr:hypothetical protein FQN49_004898 [Arthroderma sp. PD_2]